MEFDGQSTVLLVFFTFIRVIFISVVNSSVDLSNYFDISSDNFLAIINSFSSSELSFTNFYYSFFIPNGSNKLII